MKRYLRFILVFTLVLCVLTIPVLTMALDGDPGSDTGATGELQNPLKYKSMCELIAKLLEIVAELGAIVGVLFIIWSGFQFITAQGNPEKISAAKRTFYMTIIGVAILLGASVIAKLIFNTVMSVISKTPSTSCTI